MKKPGTSARVKSLVLLQGFSDTVNDHKVQDHHAGRGEFKG